jgi:FHS family L-fucose permease-like MFS transporter
MNASEPRSVRTLLLSVYFIYFFCGMTLCFEGVFLPEFKEYFQLNYQQQMYTMFAKNVPFLAAVGIGLLAQRIGLKNCLSLAMLLYALGTLLLVPALASNQDYWMVLAAFFIIGMGFNCQLVAGNPLLGELGPAADASSRLNLGNALGAVAQIIAPATLAFIIPATVTSVAGKLPYMRGLFATIGVALMLIAIFMKLAKSVDFSERSQPVHNEAAGTYSAPAIWKSPKVLLGFVAVFLVLGAEAGLFGLYRNYLEDSQIGGLSSRQSQTMFTVYFAMFALGRLAGSWIQKHVQPAITLAFSLIMAMLLVGAAVVARGAPAIVAVTSLGFFVSIFFPTLYSLAIEGLGQQTAQASGLLTMGFLGCALVPVLQGRLADAVGLQKSYVLCFVAYVFALFYAVKGHRLGTDSANAL